MSIRECQNGGDSSDDVTEITREATFCALACATAVVFWNSQSQKYIKLKQLRCAELSRLDGVQSRCEGCSSGEGIQW